MKNGKEFLIVGTIILVMSVCSLVVFEANEEKNIFSTKNSEAECTSKIYYEEDGRRIYSYCLESIKYNGKELNKLLSDGMKIEKVIGTLKKTGDYYDGGSKMYRGKNISILTCNTLDGNKDIYIGNSKMEYEDNFCKTMKESFKRTYRILNVAESNDYKYLYVTLRQFQAEEVETVKVLRKDFEKVEVDKNYEIVFRNKGIKRDTIEDIFTNSEVISVVFTTNLGLDEVNEAI